MERSLIYPANRLKHLFGGDFNKAARAVAEVKARDTTAFNTAISTGDVTPIGQVMQRMGIIQDYDAPTGNNFRHGLGAFNEGFLRTFDGKEGYVADMSSGKPVETVRVESPDYQQKVGVKNYELLDQQPQVPYGRHFYEVSSDGADYNLGEEALFRAGAIAGDVAGSATRAALIWRSSPPDVADRMGSRIVMDQPDGLPAPVPYRDKTTGQNKVLPGSREAAALAALGGMATVELMNIGSGNYNPLNPEEGFRVAGFSAVSADPDGDRRVPTNLVSEVLQRHLLGRKGKLLPWEQFKLERPDVGYEEYKDYKDWQYGRDEDDIAAKLTAGFVKFNPSGLSGMPELNMVGTTVTPVGIGAGVLGALGVKQLNRALGQASLAEYQQLKDAAATRALTDDESLRFLGNDALNAHARVVNRDHTGLRRQIYS